VAWQLLLSWP